MEHVDLNERMEHVDLEDKVPMVDSGEIVDADPEIEPPFSSSSQFEYFSNSGMISIENRNDEYKIIKQCFLKAMRLFGKNTSVFAIHKNPYTGILGRARSENFRIFSRAVAAKCGGDANIRHGWYVASREEICEIITHGFSQPRKLQNGFGICIFPANFASDGFLSVDDEDEDGLRHMILCKVILGNMEPIPAGSEQYQPSSKEFDSGVDNISSPRRYIIWSAFMNSHIFPNYIVSFKAHSSVRGFRRVRTSILKPNSPYMKFTTLLSNLSSFLPRSKMILIENYHNEYHENKLSRVQLIERLRQLAGDKLLTAVIKFYRDQKFAYSALLEQNLTRKIAARG